MNRRLIAATLVLVGGALHTSLAYDQYGTSELVEVFFVNGIASAVVAGAIALGRGLLGPIAGLGVSSMSLFALALSRIGDGVVGFRGSGLDPAPEAALTVVVELAASALLALLVIEHRAELLATLRSATGDCRVIR